LKRHIGWNGNWHCFLQWFTALAVIIGISVSGRWFVKSHMSGKMDVFLDDQWIGTVSSADMVIRWKESVYNNWRERFAHADIVSKLDRLRLKQTERFRLGTDDEQVMQSLRQAAVPSALAVEIVVDGLSFGYIRNREAAEELFERLKRPFAPASYRALSERLRPVSMSASAAAPAAQVEFVEAVELRERTVPPELVEPPEELFRKLSAEREQAQEYIVQKGDCISVIAARLGIPQRDIYELNPWIENDLIRPGDRLVWKKNKPVLSVKTVETRQETVKIPNPIIYEKDETLDSGVIQIASEGKPGIKRVSISSVKIDGQLVENKTVGETLIEEPVPTVVKQGTKRSGIGTGSFVHPVIKPTITSEFGLRWGKSHTGTDFVSDEPSILAADSGKVAFAGIKSGYGNCIIIDHQNGYETLYGHLSKIGVRVGDNVAKGDKIGVMGSTGKSTGVHLHFEIIRNGKQENPMKYLRS